MRLTQPQRLKLGRLLKEKVGAFPPCAVCGNASGWILPTSFVFAPAIAPEEGEPVGVPFVAITCNVCGHALLFHARVLGIMDGDGDAAGPSPSPAPSTDARDDAA